MKIKNILVPIDFSDCSKNALRYAIPIAKKHGAKIHMVNAVHVHAPHPDVVGGSLVSAVIADYEEQVKASFEALEKEIIELKDVPHEADRFLAYLIDAIHSECEKKKIDMIVMGTRAEHDEVDRVLGSRTTDVLDTAHVPVLVVPENWLETKIEKIGFACRLEQVKNIKTLKRLNSFALDNNAKVLAFSVMENPDTITLKDQKVYKEIVDSFDEGVASYRTFQSANPIQGIHEFCHVQGLDVLAVIPKDRGFWDRLFKKSVSKTILLSIDIPVLALKE